MAVSAAAAMAAAAPHSAWQPPSAPDMLAWLAMACPTAAAVNKASTASSSVAPRSSIMASTAPGRIPQAPAVGAATIFPMQALHSAVARAYTSARPSRFPQRSLPSCSRFINMAACPPVSPDTERRRSSRPLRAASRMQCR